MGPWGPRVRKFDGPLAPRVVDCPWTHLRCVQGFLRWTGLTAGGFLSLTAFQAEGCGIARRAMSMKSALRDWLSVSYVTQYPVPPIFSFPLEVAKELDL